MYKLIILLVVLINFIQDGVVSQNITTMSIESYSGLNQTNRRTRSAWGRGSSRSRYQKRHPSPIVQSYDMVGGRPADTEEIPFIVSLIQDSTNKHFCGGTIIGKMHVITAAHCLCGSMNYKAADDILVIVSADRIGTSDIDVPQVYHVAKTLCHPKFQESTLEHDLALLVLQSNFRFSPSVYQINMLIGNFVEREPYPSFRPVILAGWGKKLNQVRDSTRYLKFIKTETIDLDECNELLKSSGFIAFGKPDNICTFNTKSRNCIGNVGTPVIDNKYLVGVTTWSKCDSDLPDIHASIKHHYTWIYEQMMNDLH